MDILDKIHKESEDLLERILDCFNKEFNKKDKETDESGTSEDYKQS